MPYFWKIPFKSVLKSFDGPSLLSCKRIFIHRNWKKSDSWGSYNSWVSDNSWESYNSWGSYILVGKVDDFRFDLLPCVRYGVHTFCYVATNQDVLLFKLLNFLGVLLTKTCYNCFAIFCQYYVTLGTLRHNSRFTYLLIFWTSYFPLYGGFDFHSHHWFAVKSLMGGFS